MFPERVGGPARGPLRRLPLGDRGHLRTGLCRLRVNLLWEKPCLALVWNSLAWWHLQHLAGCSSHFSSWCFTVLYLVVLICFALVPALQFHFRTFWGVILLLVFFPDNLQTRPWISWLCSGRHCLFYLDCTDLPRAGTLHTTLYLGSLFGIFGVAFIAGDFPGPISATSNFSAVGRRLVLRWPDTGPLYSQDLNSFCLRLDSIFAVVTACWTAQWLIYVFISEYFLIPFYCHWPCERFLLRHRHCGGKHAEVVL